MRPRHSHHCWAPLEVEDRTPTHWRRHRVPSVPMEERESCQLLQRMDLLLLERMGINNNKRNSMKSLTSSVTMPLASHKQSLSYSELWELNPVCKTPKRIKLSSYTL